MKPTTHAAHETSQARPWAACSVVVPVYNEVESLPATIDALHSALRDAEVEYEVIVVDDGSTDATPEILLRRDDIVSIRHERNRGYGAALKSGIRRARHPLVAITDADGTYPSDRIPDLLRLMDGADMVVGSRTGPEAPQLRRRRFAKWFLHRFAEWMARSPIPDLNSGLRVFPRELAERFMSILPDQFSFTSTLTLAMLTNGYHVRFEPISLRPRVGRSKIRPVRDTLRFLQLILRTGMYFAPLRVFMPLAFLFLLAFIGSAAYDIFVRHNLTDKTVMLLVAATQLGVFALLADMIDKRSGAPRAGNGGGHQ